MSIDDPLLWTALLKIIGVNIVLSGDNAVVIALAARSLPPKQQKQAIFWGSAAAIILRIVLTLFAVALLALPWLKLIGSALLLWIGIKLLVPEEGEDNVEASDNLLVAIRTILIADLVMSLDNVIAVAAAAGGHWALMIVGLAISIPIVIFGATLLVKVMERFPIIITLGAALLGFVAGRWRGKICRRRVHEPVSGEHEYAAALANAVLVVVWGQWLARRACARWRVAKVSESNAAR
jgi:YjbE family integral membrane protein